LSRVGFATATTVLAVAALGLLEAAGVGARERPVWSQYQGGPTHAGFLAEGPQPPYRVRWTLPAPSGDALSPAVVIGERAVAVGADAVYAVDVATGVATRLAPRSGGPLSAPAVANAGDRSILVYIEGPAGEGSPSPSPSAPTSTSTASPAASASTTSASPSASADEQEGSWLVGFALEDETERWRTQLEGISRSGVTVEGGNAYVGDQEGNVYAVSLASGAVVWSSEIGGRVDTPVAVADGNVYVVARDADGPRVLIAAFDALTGERAWPAASTVATSTAGSAPTAGRGSVFVGSADRLARALADADGAERWTSLVLSLFSPATSPAFDGESVFVADVSGGLYRLDAGDGTRSWSYQFNEVVFRSSPVVSGPSVLLGLGDGSLVAVDAGTGHLVWQSGPSPGLIGTIALSEDAVIAVKGGRDAGLVAFEHDPDGALIDVPSPSELDVGTTFSRYAIAAVIVFAFAFVPGRLAARRFGAATLARDGAEPHPEGEDEAEPEPSLDEGEDPSDAGHSDEDDR
jgi:outer membrane protein assembly factor BamB